MSIKQKFHKGDQVRIKDLGPSMDHLDQSQDAIVIASHYDQYEGRLQGKSQYSLFIRGTGHVAWYNEKDLTLIKIRNIDLLEKWEEEMGEYADKENLDIPITAIKNKQFVNIKNLHYALNYILESDDSSKKVQRLMDYLASSYKKS